MSDEQKQGPQRPTSDDDREGWKAYWAAQGMPWRIDPEVDLQRQQYLAERLSTNPSTTLGIYPFRDVKLGRADVEWLLATHVSEGVEGPVNWSDEKQRTRQGLDLRGADLSGTDLHGLPLTRMVGGAKRFAKLPEQRQWAAVRLTRAKLDQAHLEGAILNGADLERASATAAQFEAAQLEQAHMLGCYLPKTQMRGAILTKANLAFACLDWARLEHAQLDEAQLPHTLLMWAHLEGANLMAAQAPRANFHEAYFDRDTSLSQVVLYDQQSGGASLADVHWEGANLATVDWMNLQVLGEEIEARSRHNTHGRKIDKTKRRENYEIAVRANRQLATVLRSQGLNEAADRFAYRAQLMQRRVLHLQQHYLRAFGSWLLDLISGYGYKPMRSIMAYVVIICAFAGAYLLHAQFAAPHLTWDESLVLSISSFHGRGFFSSGINLSDMLARLAAGEAIAGLLIEITLIATFTQRFFAR